MIDDLNNKYLEIKNVIDILPINTKYNRKKKFDYIMEEVENDNERIKLVKQEIEERIKQFNDFSINPEIEEINMNLEKCNIINEWNQYNTAYEKMHLDYYLYQLHRYYKEDLHSVNSCIKKILDAFKKVSIDIKKDDFDFNNYASLYMDKIINNASDEELTSCFEEIYWKNSDIIKIIEINFKSIYLKNEKKINKYYESRHSEFLKNHNDLEIYKMKINLNKKLEILKGNDKFLNFKKFENNEYNISDYDANQIAKKRDTYFSSDSYDFNSLLELYNVLNEYNVLIKYKYLFTDMKDKLEKRDSLKNAKNIALKEIIKEENNLRKINNNQNKKKIFGKMKNNEKLLFEYRKSLDNVIKYYDNFDNACFNDLVFNKLSLDSSVLEILKLICSNYIYFVNKTHELDENRDINDITNEFESLRNYVNNKEFVILNNIALLDEKQMKQLIVDKYNLSHINITLDNLLEGNIATTINDFEKLINYENIINSGIDIEDLSLYLEYKKVFK